MDNLMKIEVVVVNAVLDFLSKQAFKDVSGLIQAIHQSANKHNPKDEPEVAPAAE